METGNRKFGKREQLIKAAMGEFAENYFDHASLNNILDSSSVGKGTFYYHFENKEQLYLAAVDELIKMKLDFFRMHSSKDLSAMDIFGILREQGRVAVEFILTDPVIERLSKRISQEPNSRIRAAVRAKTGEDAGKYLEIMVSEAVKSGTIRYDIPKHFILKLLGFLVNNFTSVFSADAGLGDNEDILMKWDIYMEFMKNGLAGKEINSVTKMN